MSDNWLRYVPSDPYFLPPVDVADSARKLLWTFLPDAEEVSARHFERPMFIDPGGNWSGVLCSVCGADAESWWSAAVMVAARQDFASFDTVTPCCQSKVSLNDLHYVWPAGFGRFVLDAMNPNVDGLSTAHIARLEALLGCSVREISQHI